jgi:hypothetical protein
MHFEILKHYKREVVLNDRGRGSLVFNTVHWIDPKEKNVYSILTLDYDAIGMHARITPAEAREFAAALIAHADDVEAHQKQVDSESNVAMNATAVALSCIAGALS